MPLPLSIPALTRASASGDAEAFAVIYRAKFARTLAVARRVFGEDEQRCLDAVQDAWTRYAKRPPVCDAEAALDAWLDRAVKCAAIDMLRREQRARLREHASSNGRAHQAERSAPAHDLEERLAALRDEVRALEREARDLLEMRHRLGMTFAQIGAATGVGTGAAHARWRRIVAGLRDRMKERDHV